MILEESAVVGEEEMTVLHAHPLLKGGKGGQLQHIHSHTRSLILGGGGDKMDTLKVIILCRTASDKKFKFVQNSVR